MIKRFLIIGLLVVWLPMNLGVTQIKIREYDGSQEPEKWFFDSVIDENGKLLLSSYRSYLRYGFGYALDDMLEKRLGCIRTNEVARWHNGNSSALSHRLFILRSRPPFKYKLYENRYLNFRACKHGFCSLESYYIVDTLKKDIAVAMINSTNIFSRLRNKYGHPISDLDNYYIKLFVSDKASQDFIKKSIEFTKDLNYPTKRRIETYTADCRIEN